MSEEIEKAQILFVDDEPNILRSLERAFFETDYITYTACGAVEALELLETTKVQMVISDMRMPDIDGYEFLQRVKEKHPHVIRVVLSGYSEKEQLTRTVSDSIVRAYLYKPWENDALLQWVDGCFKMFEDTHSVWVKLAIAEFGLKLPHLSKDFQQFQELFKYSCNMDQMIGAISANSDYSQSLLQTVNSPAFDKTFTDVGDAVKYLGVTVTKEIILHSEVMRSIKKLAPAGYNHVLCEFDNHCAVLNKVFHDIYEHVNGGLVPDKYKVVTLFHDIGKLMLFCCLPDRYESIKDGCVHGRDIVDHEREKLRIDHCMMGAYLCHYWSLPLVVQEICLYHHSFSECNEQHRKLIAMISVADAVASYVVEKAPLDIIDNELALLGLNVSDIDSLKSVKEWDKIEGSCYDS